MIDVSEEKRTPRVSLLLLTHDRYQMTKYVLTTLLKNTGYSDFELLILDNGSQDKRVHTLIEEESFPLVQSGSMELSAVNLGIASGFNKLLRKAQGEYVVFLSNDILLGENWLADLIHYNDEVEKSGVTSIHCEGAKGQFTQLSNIHDTFTYIWKTQDNLTSGVSLINRQVASLIGLMDETLGIYGREREQYGIRVSALGYNNYYIPDQYSVHLGRGLNEGKEKHLQLSSNRFKESLMEMRKSRSFKI